VPSPLRHDRDFLPLPVFLLLQPPPRFLERSIDGVGTLDVGAHGLPFPTRLSIRIWLSKVLLTGCGVRWRFTQSASRKADARAFAHTPTPKIDCARERQRGLAKFLQYFWRAFFTDHDQGGTYRVANHKYCSIGSSPTVT
jgi:hypothetical protein